MSLSTYLWCFLAGVLGTLIHLFAVKIPAVKKSAVAANIKFTYSGLFEDELAAILANLFSILAVLLVLDEVLKFKPELLSWLKIFFLTFGFMGSSLMVAWLGKAADKINSVVDVKTNIADGVAPPPDPGPSI